MADDTRLPSRGILNAAILLLLWEVVGRLDLVAGGALPGFTEILIRLWEDRGDYPRHIWATLAASGAGFVIGNLVAIAAGVIFALSPVALRLFRGVNIAVFALPPIAIAPILVLTLSGMAPRIVLAALGVYFVTMTATVIGLSQADSRATDLIRAYGGSRRDALRFVMFRGAMPSILAGLRVAAPNAVLGAILAEFGGGGRWGLGAYLLGSLGRGEPDRLWGIGLVATVIAGLSYGIFALLSRRVVGATRAVTINSAIPEAARPVGNQLGRAALAAGAIALPFVLWWAFIWMTGVPDLISKTPWGVIDYLFLSRSAEAAQARLLAALGETLPITFLGMIAGLAFAFLLAVSSKLFPRAIEAFMPVALITQTMPLVALTPLLLLSVAFYQIVVIVERRVLRRECSSAPCPSCCAADQ
jgi:sulfonate transport system permease protein